MISNVRRSAGVFLFAGILGAASWPRPYRIPLQVTVQRKNTPVSARIDFAAIPNLRGHIDANSLLLTGPAGEAAMQSSESLENGGTSAEISWVVADPRHHRYHLYFNLIENERRPFRDYRPPIGLGDAFFYNRPAGFDYLGVGMQNDQPAAVDWDGDGRIDILQRNLYSYTFGEPWWGVFFWRNIGTNAAPRFDRYIRLRADHALIEDVYGSYQPFDWNADGKIDLVCGVGGGKLGGTLKVYLNTGESDANGLPVLRAGPRIEWQPGGTLHYGMRLLDWTGRGVFDLFTLRMRVDYFPVQQVDYTWYRHPNLSSRGETPRFGAPEALPLNGQTVYDRWPTSLYDVNHDGAPDLIGMDQGLGTRPLQTCVAWWRNTGTTAKPRFDSAPECFADLSPLGFAVPLATGSPTLPGFLSSYMGSWLRLGPPMGPPLEARGLPCSSGGYNSTEVADFDGDGDLDFIVGNESGFVQWIENIGTPARSMFARPLPIPLADGAKMYAARWQFIDDKDPEIPFGQSKPAYVDWDGDGDMDMLVGNNSNRIAYFENIGTRSRPRFAPMKPLTHDGGERFWFRGHPAPVDWDGDGLLDLVAGSSPGQDRNTGPDITVCLYRRYRSPDGALHLRRGEPLRLTDGSEMRTPIPYHHGFEVVDWDGDGALDILASEKSQLIVYRNEGTNARPRFRRDFIRLYGKPVSVSHHETSLKAVDWDRDGALDLLLGGESGWIYFFRRAALDTSAPPSVEVGRLEVAKP